MSSRRKSFVPCMVPAASSTVDMDLSTESLQNLHSPVLTSTNENWTTLNDEEEGQTDGQCSFNTNNLRKHVDSSQSEGPFDVLYLCTFCDFSTNNFDSLSYHKKAQHPGKSLVKFKQIKLDSQTILERTIENECVPEELSENAVKELEPASSSTAEDDEKIPIGNRNILENGPEVDYQLDNPMLKDEIRAVSVNGTIIVPEPMSHVTPLLQRPPNLSITPTIAVPLHTNKYNPILDSNTTLIASFNRFPYPTHAELSWLTAASKHPEEQIKVWFTTQRLKQGITWSPEEVEEARKKMFNGSIPPVYQSCSVWPSSIIETIKPSPSVAQKPNCHVTEQTSLVSNGSITACQPVPATEVNQTLILKRSLGTPLLASEIKRAVVPQTGDLKESLCMPPPPAPAAEGLTSASSSVFPETKTSSSALVASDFKRPIVAPFVPPKGKPPLVPPKEKIPVVLPSVLPKERLPLAPIVSTNLKRSIVPQQMSSHISANSSNPLNKLHFGNLVNMSSAAAVLAPHVNRPTIIQPPCIPPAASPLSSAHSPVFEWKSLKPSVAPMFTCSSSQNGDAKSWFLDQTANSLNEFQHTIGALRERPVPTQFPLLERVKGKSPGQMKLLEESFQRNSFPSFNEVDHLMISTRLSREEIESWFLERRALRDDLEQALLNSMGSKKGPQQSKQVLLNGAQKHGGTLSFAPVDSKSVSLLKNVFVQTRWPSPAELRLLEMQKGFAHTDFVHWFRDSRLAQGKEMFGEQNGCRAADTSKQPSQKEQLQTDETNKPSSPEIEDLFTSMLGQYWQDMDSNEGAVSGGTESCGGWRCNTIGVEARAGSCELVSDTD